MARTFLHDGARAALSMLQCAGTAVVPRSVCNGAKLWALANDGLIEKTEIAGVWAITAAGRRIDVNDWDRKSPTVDDILFDEYDRASDPKEGDVVFGRTVAKEDMEYLAHRPAHHRFIYFAYPAGYPLRIIANTIWRKGAARVPWVSEDVTAVRALRLKLPRRTEIKVADPAADALRTRLINEGCTDEEVDEFFARKRRVAQ